MRSGGRLTKFQTTTRPDHVWPEEWSKIGKAAQKEKQEWKNEKPKLDNARRLRGRYFVDPDDEEYKETLLKSDEKIGKSCGRDHAVQKKKKIHSSTRKLAAELNSSHKVPKTKYG